MVEEEELNTKYLGDNSVGPGAYYSEDELSWNNREDYFRLPVPPLSPPEVSYGTSNETWNTTDVGPFKSIGKPTLKSVSVNSIFPAQRYPFCTTYSILKPEEYIKYIQKWIDSSRPIRYIRTGVFNLALSIENFSYYKEEGTGDYYFTLDLEQYKFRSDSNPQTGNFVREDEIADDRLITYITLEKGQTLCELAEEWLGDSGRYKEIAEANGIEDVGHPWAETEKNNHQLEITCEEGTPGYDRIKNQVLSGKGLG